jgi:Type VI secretion system/phage-baseplate injector OB domain
MSWLNRLRNHIRQEAQRATSDLSLPRAAIVTGSIDPARYSARVLLQPEGTLTGYLPIASQWVGNGWGMFCLPSPGDVVDVIFQQGGHGAGVIVGRQFNAKAQPVPTTSGEFWLVHQTGTKINLTNDGNILISAHADLRIEANNIKIHARQTYAFDANGQGQKWDGAGVETWQDNDVPKPHHNHAPPETP